MAKITDELLDEIGKGIDEVEQGLIEKILKTEYDDAESVFAQMREDAESVFTQMKE